MLHSVLRTIAAGSVAAAIFACGGSDNSTGPTPVFTSVVVTPASPAVAVGSTQTLTATAKDQSGATFAGAPGATWTSSNTAVATVDPATGVVTGVANGSSMITASITVASVTHTGTQSIAVSTPSATGAVTAKSSLAFDPPTVTIVRSGGTGTVTWTFENVEHTVNWDQQPSGASVANIGLTSSTDIARDFTVAGNYTYHCSIHPQMTGTVVVQ